MKAIEEKLLQEDQDKMTMNVEEMNEDDLELLLEDSMDEESDDDAKAEEVQKLLKDAEIEKQNKGIGGLLNALPVSESMSALTGSSKAQDETMASNKGGEKRDDVQKKSFFFKDLAFLKKTKSERAKENKTSENEADNEAKQDSVRPEVAGEKIDDENSVESKSSGESKRGGSEGGKRKKRKRRKSKKK